MSLLEVSLYPKFRKLEGCGDIKPQLLPILKVWIVVFAVFDVILFFISEKFFSMSEPSSLVLFFCSEYKPCLKRTGKVNKFD